MIILLIFGCKVIIMNRLDYVNVIVMIKVLDIISPLPPPPSLLRSITGPKPGPVPEPQPNIY